MAEEIEDRGPLLDAINIAFLVISVTIVGLRCYVRVFMVKRFGLDDWAMLLATTFFVSYCVCSISGVHYGTGRHKWDLSTEGYAKGREFWWFCYLTYCWSMILSKASIALFLLRVTAYRIHVWIIWGAMAISFVTCMAFFFVTVFQCYPVSYFWDQYTQSGTCVNVEVIVALGYLYSVCSIITDFTFALLPAWIISHLNMKARTKIALIPLLAMGCVASSAVIVRCIYMSTFRSPDYLWATADIAVWSTVEQGLAISAASLATLRPLIKLIGYKLGITTRPTGPSDGYKGPSAHLGSLSGPISRRRGSQSAANALILNTLNKSVFRDAKDEYDLTAVYEVRCEAGLGSPGARDGPLPGAISQGRTYEVTSKSIESGSCTEKPKSISSQVGKSSFTRPRNETSDSDSIEALRPELSPAVPRSFLQSNQDSK
ncbi:Uu.00g053940.m01.CDS01 [Anthostomella pinea]|uniref:Uu.00g053940.m01.CDS01 n=1 Tax=Anthostomella pinea TaxID=933095 RepID=A0AAI8YPG5_9PEZI|nr:Uu.00g053940.m01.CDS01 [Anthostomella pinea]